jgi:hypothetical protein
METTKQGGQKLRLNSIRGFVNPLNIDFFISLVNFELLVKLPSCTRL